MTLENMLNTRIPFSYQREDERYDDYTATDYYVEFICIYKSKEIQDSTKYNILTPYKLIAKINPFLLYLESKYIHKISSLNFNVSNYKIRFSAEIFQPSTINQKSKYYGVFNIDIINNTNTSYYDTSIKQYQNKLFTNPFEIHIDVVAGYFIEEEEEEEEEKPITVIKSFREDKCVVCLMNEPKVLFYDCMHYCVCLECEGIKPFKSCPCCRTHISTKII